MTRKVDYSLYLVTGRDLLPPGVDYYESLELSIKGGGVTIVQLREKSIETSEFLDIARKSLEICDKYKIPMLINDNISVALALPERVGLHIGQTDLPIDHARKLLGPNRLLGHSVHNVQQAEEAFKTGIADYVGVGPCYGTRSKAGIEEKDVLTVRGAQQVIGQLSYKGKRMPSVLIGGINQRTAARALVGTTSLYNSPDGIAVISAIVSRRDPGVAAKELLEIVHAFKRGLDESKTAKGKILPFSPALLVTKEDLLVQCASWLFEEVRKGTYGTPLIQTLTSHVSSNLSANVAIALSASPIMSHQEEEAEDLGKVVGAVVLNIGTVGAEARKGMKAVGTTANRMRKPVVLDPVGVGASAFRKEVVDEIMNHTQVTLIKGNAAELSAIAGHKQVASRGVDSGSGTLSDPKGLVERLARKERCMVLLTGKTDYLSNGTITVKMYNGHPLLGKITGSGCALGVAVAVGLAAASMKVKHEVPKFLSQTIVNGEPDYLFIGAILGVLAVTIASELAAERSDVKGPGSFIPAFIDELAALTPEKILERAKAEAFHPLRF